MKPSTIKNRKGRKLDRVSKVLEAQPSLSDNQVRTLLIIVHQDLTRRDCSNETIQRYLDKIVGLLCKLDERQVAILREKLPNK